MDSILYDSSRDCKLFFQKFFGNNFPRKLRLFSRSEPSEQRQFPKLDGARAHPEIRNFSYRANAAIWSSQQPSQARCAFPPQPFGSVPDTARLFGKAPPRCDIS